MFRVSIAIFAIMISSASFVYNMDPVPIYDNQMIAWKIILEHGVGCFDYRNIQSLMVSKTHDKLLRDTAECRKKYLIEQLNLKPDNITWHKYGAMCGWVIFGFHEVYMRRFYLHQYGYRYQPVTVYLDKIENPLSHHPRPYFNNRGAFCFYTYSTSHCDEKSGTILKNKWRSSRQSSTLGLGSENCMAHIGDQEVKLKMFLEFPVLLKAFLKSRIVYKKKDNWWETYCDTIKIYDLEGVILPNNYRKHKQYFSTITCASFDDLPREIRKAIVARYKAQTK